MLMRLFLRRLGSYLEETGEGGGDDDDDDVGDKQFISALVNKHSRLQNSRDEDE